VTVPSHILPHGLLGLGAFQLLASSTLASYERNARAIASQVSDIDGVPIDGIDAHTLISLAMQRWRYLLQNSQRQPQEVDLAALVVLIGKRSAPAADAFLSQLAVSNVAVVAWIAALARTTLSTRRSNYSFHWAVSTQRTWTVDWMSLVTPGAASSFQLSAPTLDVGQDENQVADLSLAAA
jgi:hypothetical protein